ncbi:MAG: P-loop NTPase [Candidatus Hadarchaeum sp.]|uniref:nucleotide-binding protein n=1 Tax=Candidatus Hadarchaeum sp. TaxID=2883567 RepID=UPI00317FB8FA
MGSEPEKDRSKKLLSLLKPAKERGIEIKEKRAIITGVFSCKGGVGKTTTLANLALCAAQIFKGNVLAIDANLSAPNLGLHFGELDPKVTIHDALAGQIPVEKTIMDYHGLDLILGSIAFGEEVHLVDLKGLLEPLRSKYRLILIDSAPGIGAEVISAMKICDEIIIVTNPEIPTVASTLKTFRAAERYKIPILGVVVNKVRNEPFELTIKDVKKALGWPIIAVVPEDIKVREATAAGIPVVSYHPKSPAAVEFKRLGEFITKHVLKS